MAQNQDINLSSYKAGNTVNQLTGNKSFIPTSITAKWQIDNMEVLALLSKADQKLGALNAYGALVPDIDFFIRMHVLREATLSARIEGTQTHVNEVLMKEEDIKPERRDDWAEVQNYIIAANWAIEELNRLPLSNRLLRDTHRILLQGVRGKNKQPGEFRRSQNWIGGASLLDAVFIPPPESMVPEFMSDLEKFLHNEELNLPPLLRAGIAHYQFETIHPFLDGNGRLGRLMIILYLVSVKALDKPSLYLSWYFEKNKSLYYENLMKVRQKSDLTQWLKFFLVGVYETAENAIETFKQILQMKTRLETEKLPTLGKKLPLANRFLQLLFTHPILDTAYTAQILGMSIPTAYRLITDFVRLGILVEMTGYKRNRLFSFKEYVALFED